MNSLVLGVALSFLSECTFLAPFFYFLLFLSFSLSLYLFSLLLLVVRFPSASKTNNLGFTEFLLQWGRGGYVQTGGGQVT